MHTEQNLSVGWMYLVGPPAPILAFEIRQNLDTIIYQNLKKFLLKKRKKMLSFENRILHN